MVNNVSTLQVHIFGSWINLFCQARNKRQTLLHRKWSHQYGVGSFSCLLYNVYYLYLFTYTGVQHALHIRWCSCSLTVGHRMSRVEHELLSLPEDLNLHPVFSGVRVALYKVCRSLFVLLVVFFSFGHYIVCPLIYGFWLPLWCLQIWIDLGDCYHTSSKLRCQKAWAMYVDCLLSNATFNNISVISWRSILLVEETRGPGENHHPVARHWQTLSHNVVSSTPRHERGSNSQL